MDVFWQSWRCQNRSLQARLKLIRPNNLERIQILADEFSKSSNYTSWWTFATSVGLSFSAFVVDLLNMSMVILLTQDGNSFALMGGGQNDCANLRYFKIVTNLVIIHYSTLAIGDFVNFMKDFFPFGRSTFKRYYNEQVLIFFSRNLKKSVAFSLIDWVSTIGNGISA